MTDEHQQPETQPVAPSAPAAGRSNPGQKLGRVTLGGALLAMDTLSQRLERLEEPPPDESARRRTLDDVLVPVSQWPEQFGVAAHRPARHLMLGLMVDARSRTGAASRYFNILGRQVARTIDLLLHPVQTRPVFRPLRHGFEKALARGEGQVARWQAMGRLEEARSRALAGNALASAAEETMTELVGNERVEVFVQEIIESQTAGIVDEIVEEIRERAVSSDNFFEQAARRLLRRPHRSQAPKPDFDPRLVRPILRRGLPIPAGSLLGHYAGFVSRLLALLVDVALIVIALALGGSLLTTAVDVLGLRGWFDSVAGPSGLFGGLFAGISGLAIVIGYLVLFWLLTGQTLGMMLMGLRVANRAGGRLGFWQAIVRIIGYLILPGIYFFGFLWILGDDKRQAWHDKLARTCVVYAWDARPDETFLTET
ncbi:MAG: RDD family protein [Chloroflexota bacterium]|jgi:uncharacterized RDD family membrane protein YckC